MADGAVAADPFDNVRKLYEDAEAATASALEKVVASNAFGELLALTAGNAMALARVGNSALDQLVRTLRVAGRGDIARLGRQQARTEDKLELLLQAVEDLQAQVAASGRQPQQPVPPVVSLPRDSQAGTTP